MPMNWLWKPQIWAFPYLVLPDSSLAVTYYVCWLLKVKLLSELSLGLGLLRVSTDVERANRADSVWDLANASLRDVLLLLEQKKL